MATMADDLGAPNLTERPTVRPGEPAPDFVLPALHDTRTVALRDYRGKSALLLAIERGLFCPFCRRHIAHLGLAASKLRALGVDVLSVVGTPVARARMYLAARPAPVPMVADPTHSLHRAYGLPRFPSTPETEARAASALINPFGELPAPRPLKHLAEEISRDDPYEWTAADQEAFDLGQMATTGQILIDRDGVVRWVNVEGAGDGLAGLGRFPSEKELLAAARAL